MTQISKIKEIIDTLTNTSSLKEKEAYLRQHEDNAELFMLLQMHENPYRQFYVAKLPVVRPDAEAVSLGGGSNLDKFMHLCGLLCARELSGHQALATVYDFLKNCDADEKWVFTKVLLKEPLNFGTSLINKVKPNLIPEFKLMLADGDMPKLVQIKYPIIAQTKLDGFRCVYFPDTKTFMGRNGRPIKNTNINKFFAEMIKLNKTHVLDGELFSDKLSFNQIASALNSEDKSLDGMYYCLYDGMPVAEWHKNKCTTLYKDRYEWLKDNVAEWNLNNIKRVYSKLCADADEVEQMYKEVLRDDQEGLMLKDPNGLYNWKRVSMKSGIMMKLKPHDEYDGKIIGYEEGTGKHKGKLGALIVDVKEVKNVVRVGSGFNDIQREAYWSTKDEMIGQWIKLKGFEITEGKESLRFPVFISVRDSKD